MKRLLLFFRIFVDVRLLKSPAKSKSGRGSCQVGKVQVLRDEIQKK
jgi:hypothetical protein